jgi:hypothetical protein
MTLCGEDDEFAADDTQLHLHEVRDAEPMERLVEEVPVVLKALVL